MSSTSNSCGFALPPTLEYHLIQGHAPKPIYYYFWAFGAASIVAIVFVLGRRFRKIYRDATQYRDDNDMVMLPVPYLTLLLILGYPIVSSICKFISLLAPYTSYTNSFLIKTFQGIALFYFSRLIIMYLGSYSNAMAILSTAEPTEIWAAPPFACCCKRCPFCKKTTINAKDFRIIHKMLLQFVVLSPGLAFSALIKSFSGEETAQQVIGIAQMLTSLLAMYGIGVLIKPATQVLPKKFAIGWKMKAIQITIAVSTLPGVITGFLGNSIAQNEVYNFQVMSEGCSAVAFLVLMVPVSFLYRQYFGTIDAQNANQNHFEKSHTAALSVDETKMYENNQSTERERSSANNTNKQTTAGTASSSSNVDGGNDGADDGHKDTDDIELQLKVATE